MRPRIGEKPPDHDTPDSRDVARRFRAFADEHPGMAPLICTLAARAWRDNKKLDGPLKKWQDQRLKLHGSLTHEELYADECVRPVNYDFKHIRSLPMAERVRRGVYWLAAIADEDSAAPFIPRSPYVDLFLDPDERFKQLFADSVFTFSMYNRADEARKITSHEAEELLRLVRKHLDTVWLNQLQQIRCLVASDPESLADVARWIDRAWAGRRPRQRLASLCAYLSDPDNATHADAIKHAGKPSAELIAQLAIMAAALVTDPDAADYLGSITNLAKLPFGISPERDRNVSARHLLAGRQLICDAIWDGDEPWRSQLTGALGGHRPSPTASTGVEQPRREEEQHPTDLSGYRSAKWFNKVTRIGSKSGRGTLYPAKLRAAGKRGSLKKFVKYKGQLYYDVEEVCSVYPDCAKSIKQAF